MGRTLELTIDLPYLVARFPEGLELESAFPGHPALRWTNRFAVLAVTMPAEAPAPERKPGPGELKVIEGLNSAGLSVSVQAYAAAGGPQAAVDQDKAVLSAADLGVWALGQFATVAEVRAALESQPVLLPRIPILGGLEMPFHYGIHDAGGDSLVVEFHKGQRTVLDNPVGVLTNAPQFSWHLTNLNNYTFLDNIDRSRALFGSFQAVQPGSGVAKAGLPVTDTSPDRFIRAAFYAQFAEKQSDADQAVRMVAHLMNNFDRPRGITVDPPQEGVEHLQVEGVAVPQAPTEFTSWTSLSDLERRLLFLRDGGGMDYVRLDLTALAGHTSFVAKPMQALMAPTPDASQELAD
ncbi:choloylglycine hydrolase, putative [Cyanobium sp. PCC 7001]|nr:choloylglycine hydrolase, putative [Cyanobium sp. PCC 7001]